MPCRMTLWRRLSRRGAISVGAMSSGPSARSAIGARSSPSAIAFISPSSSRAKTSRSRQLLGVLQLHPASIPVMNSNEAFPTNAASKLHLLHPLYEVKQMKQRRATYPVERPRGVATRMPGHDLAVAQDHDPVDEAPSALSLSGRPRRSANASWLTSSVNARVHSRLPLPQIFATATVVLSCSSDSGTPSPRRVRASPPSSAH